MIYAVFLCDKQWKIEKVKQCCPELDIQEGNLLTDLIREELKTESPDAKQTTLELTFRKQERTIPAIIHWYKEANLIVLATVNSNQELVELGKKYPEYQEWAQDHIFGLFHNEYYMIQQMNNQLVDAKRRLTRSNRQLEVALKENQEINHKLDEARDLAEKASRSKTRFLANMSHDIRTPMNAIVGLSELIAHYIDNPEMMKMYISKLQSSSHYLLDLINDILDLSKIENGSLELRMEPMDIGVQIEQVVTIIRPQVSQKEQALSVQCDCNEFGMVYGDPVHFRQILMNLFSNAVKYTPDGGHIRLTVHEQEKSEKVNRYEFVLEDDGIGMDPEFVSRIFEPFSRAESEVKKIQGTGLGMAITKSLIQAMRGCIRVDSAPGKGSRFYVEIPFAVCGAEIDRDEKHDREQDADISLQGMKFLCAEDNALNAEILTALLGMEGAECVVYENGKLLAEAFEAVRPGEYQAILMDVQMPVMNGYEATAAIRNSKNPLGKEIPIIAMTANAFSEDIQRCLDAGMDAHIAKPVDFEKLKRVLQKQRNKFEDSRHLPVSV